MFLTILILNLEHVASTEQPSPIQQSDNLCKCLVIGVINICVVWYLQYLWRRRYLYLSSGQLPGPLALPIVGSALSLIGDSTYIFKKISHMFNIYPGIFRLWFGTKMIYAVSEPRYIEILMNSPHALGKAFIYRILQPISGLGLFTAPVPRWKKTRKIINHAFNKKILNNSVDIFVNQSKIFVEVVQNKCTRNLDIYTLTSRFTLDSITESATGLQINAQTTASEVPLWMDRIFEICMMRMCNIFYHLDFIFYYTALGRESHCLVNKLKTLAGKVITEKRTQKEKKMINRGHEYVAKDTSKIKPFLDLLLEIEDGKICFSDNELLDETITFMVGGTDTTATTSCSVLTMLGMHQDVQEKVLAEILDVIGPERDVHFSDLSKLEYMERVIKETMRLIPVVAFIGRDVDANIDLGDHVVHRGTSVIFGVLKVHRNEKYWPDPLKFDPDRFLPEQVAKRPPGCYIPFAYGPRNCIGMRYAMMSMKTFLSTILRKFRIYTSYKSVEDIELKVNLVIRPVDGFKISIESRK